MTKKHFPFRTILLAASVGGLAFWAGFPQRAHAALDKTYEQLKILIDILDYIQENYVEDVETKKLIYGAASGMVKVLDPFSQFMDPDLHKDIKTETEGQFGGLGIRIGMREDWLTVITPLPGTPAYKAGVLPLDRIIKIEGETTKGVSLVEAVKKLRGAPGTKVSFTVARAPEGGEKDQKKEWTTHDFAITREIIKIESVQSRALSDKIGYIRIIEFSAHTSEDAYKALSKLKEGGANSLVLDMRNNPGGLLTAAVDIASDFLGEGKLVVYTQGRRPESRQDFRAGSKAPFGNIPMVVLVNEGSASGSEIVAGALQDHRRAVIVGERTFGKASVQSVIPLSDGSGLRLTVAKYYTPNGRSIQRDEKANTGGISPDIAVSVDRETEIKLQAQSEEVFAPGKEGKSMVKEAEQVKDMALERAMELLRAREVLGNLKVTDG
ncbi:MAG: S41 family peptidase [Elusimicrobia bacterium]|nr:S41 family peptidase [Elusimicrobiota bacterium]